MNWIANVFFHPLFLVGVGGALGSNLRYGVGYWLNPSTTSFPFPFGTTLVNVLGSFFLGCIAGMVNDRTQWVYLLVGVGFCGGLTTFSTFSLELVEHLQSGRAGVAILECVLNVLVGLIALYAGLWLCKGVT